MKISGYDIFEYRLSFKRPFSVLDQPLHVREGLILRLITDSGSIGVGEAAPLPGLNRETLKKAAFQLNSLRQDLLGREVPADLAGMRSSFDQMIFEGMCPSVRFGVESALVHIMAQRAGCVPAKVLGCSGVKDIAVAGLVQGSLEEIKVQTRRLLDDGFNVFKLKVGSRNIPLDVQKVQWLRDAIGSHGKIRLDANRAWSLTEAAAFCHNAGQDGIEFIEEPLKDISGLSVFIRETGFPVALDESLMSVPDASVFPEGVVCFVIKPAIAGGILKTLDWIAKAQKEGGGVVISSVFESGIAGRMLANLAAFSSMAAGLGTEDWLAEDLLPAMRADGRPVILKESLSWDWQQMDPKNLIPLGQA